MSDRRRSLPIVDDAATGPGGATPAGDGAASGPGAANAAPASDFASVYPGSTKVYVDGGDGVRVPMREMALSGGEPPLRVYDTSGPQGCDARQGLPKLRRDWILSRGDVEAAHRSMEVPGAGDGSSAKSASGDASSGNGASGDHASGNGGSGNGGSEGRRQGPAVEMPEALLP